MRIKIKTLSYFLLFAAIFLIIRAHSFNMPFERDEGGYAYVAHFLSKGLVPYKDSFDQKPPLIYLIYYISDLIGYRMLWVPRAIAAVFALTASFMLYFIGKKEFSPNAGKKAMWFFLAFLTIPAITPYSANTEIFMLTPLVGAFLIYIYWKNKKSYWPWYWFSVLSSLAIMFKPICIPTIAYIFTIWFFSSVPDKNKLSSIFKKFLISIAGFLTVLLPILLWLSITNSLKKFFEIVVLYNFSYSKISNINLVIILLILITAISAFKYIKLKGKSLFWFYSGILASSFLFIYQSPIFHYYLLTIPFISLAIAYSLEKLSSFSKSSLFNSAIFLVGLLMIVLPNAKSIFASKEQLVTLTYDKSNPFLESVIVGEELNKHSSPNDLVLMAGHEPQVLYYADRKSASRFIYLYTLLIPSTKRAEYENKYINDIENKNPKFVIYSPLITQKGHCGYISESLIKYLDNTIKNKYQILGGYVNGSNQGWKENLNDDDIKQSSFIIYIRK